MKQNIPFQMIQHKMRHISDAFYLLEMMIPHDKVIFCLLA